MLTNIQNAFPEKSSEEHKDIMVKFYKHFCDVIVEAIKGFTISEKQVRKRLKFRNPEALKPYFENNQDLIFVGGHYNNWEMYAYGFGIMTEHLPIGIYKPLKNKFFDRKMQESRGRYRLVLCPMKETKKHILKDFGTPKAILLASDQSPSNSRKAHWMSFLNQDTGVVFGAEKYSKEFNLPVIYAAMHKTKRGYYEFEVRPLFNNPQDTAHGEITERHTKELEKDIKAVPQYWLWTHKRWKHDRPPEM